MKCLVLSALLLSSVSPRTALADAVDDRPFKLTIGDYHYNNGGDGHDLNLRWRRSDTVRPLSPCQPIAAVIASLGSKFKLKYGFRFVRPHPANANHGSPIWKFRLAPTNPPDAV